MESDSNLLFLLKYLNIGYMITSRENEQTFERGGRTYEAVYGRNHKTSVTYE